jgi:hypothetical protein
MARMPFTGASIATPSGSREELERTLRDLGVGGAFDAPNIEDLYSRLGFIIGRWSSERAAINVSIVAEELASAETKLNELSVLLSGTETGLRDIRDITIASEIAKILAVEPSVGSVNKAQELLSAFNREAARLAHVCSIAKANLPELSGRGGRPKLNSHWYDDFTTLLLEIADKAGVTPSQQKDREDHTRSGSLLEAARALECFLPREMRSPSLEACGKRLERSETRLREVAGQKPAAS